MVGGARASRTRRSSASALGAELVGLEYEGPFDHISAQEGVVHRVIPWDDVSLDEGTGIVHIAPGAGSEDFELGRVHELPVLAPLDEAGRMLPGFGFDGLSTDEVAQPVIDDLESRGLPRRVGTIVHRYPTCWRCGTPLVFRVVDDWFIAADEIRQPMLDANATVEWTPDFYSKRMDDWLRNMGDWNISRKRYFGLPLPFYPCALRPPERDRVARRARGARGLGGSTSSRSSTGPGSTRSSIRVRGVRRGGAARPRGRRRLARRRDRPALDARLGEPRVRRRRLRDRRGEGADAADLPDHAYWEEWFPADWVSEMREQIRLWFYSISFMSVTLVGRSPYRRVLTYEKLLDETGREMHRSWGNAIAVDEALERMGADVMRWQYCSQPPSQNLLFGYGPGARDPAPAPDALELVQVPRRLREHRGVGAALRGPRERAGGRARAARPLARGADARARRRGDGRATRAGSRSTSSARTKPFVDDVSNWYIRRSRRRFWDGDADGVANALVRARPGASRRRSAHAVPHRSSLARC